MPLIASMLILALALVVFAVAMDRRGRQRSNEEDDGDTVVGYWPEVGSDGHVTFHELHGPDDSSHGGHDGTGDAGHGGVDSGHGGFDGGGVGH